jgi:hypothetical protein
VVEHFLGKEEVGSSILLNSSLSTQLTTVYNKIGISAARQIYKL